MSNGVKTKIRVDTCEHHPTSEIKMEDGNVEFHIIVPTVMAAEVGTVCKILGSTVNQIRSAINVQK